MRKLIILISLIIQSNFSHSQYIDSDLRKVFSSVVLIGDSIPKIHVINGKKYDVYLHDKLTNKLIHFKDQSSGSGFLITKGLDDYLITAEHVARNIGANGFIRFRNIKDKNIEIKISDLLPEHAKKLDWVYHPIADVAVLHLGLNQKDSLYKKNIGLSFLNFDEIKSNFSTLDRYGELTVLGFPLNHILSKKNYSPITKNLRPASDIISLNRFDKKHITNEFFLLDDPSISGFSGGLVIETFHHSVEKSGNNYTIKPSILGLVHGTVNGKSGGFAAILPSKYIIEAINMAPSTSGKYTYRYPDGSIWSEVILKNGLHWEVISNFNPNGKPQEKGNLKDGNGSFYSYNEEGTLIYIYMYKKGVLTNIEEIKE
ncbi:toxin-antitoxin system YwqK family antitoxin [Wocania ichthyoenteri]|uniref:toxin-antitoxin system YwqK family antitoxin n=1 Tax=Wocania ichthyoenteri TaxID=1230531 RepID=UPI00053E3BE9|nr:hypothetical protein [Wocania ichthyoenteri]